MLLITFALNFPLLMHFRFFANLPCHTHTHSYPHVATLQIKSKAPIFSTVRSEQLMKIYVLPRETLQIHGVREQYNYGDNISLACKAGRSWPAGKLEWYINDSPVSARSGQGNSLLLVVVVAKLIFVLFQNWHQKLFSLFPQKTGGEPICAQCARGKVFERFGGHAIDVEYTGATELLSQRCARD